MKKKIRFVFFGLRGLILALAVTGGIDDIRKGEFPLALGIFLATFFLVGAFVDFVMAFRAIKRSQIVHKSYYGGRVQSLGYRGPEGWTTVGVAVSGNYDFHPDHFEEITAVGELETLRINRAKLAYRDRITLSGRVSIGGGDTPAAYRCVVKPD